MTVKLGINGIAELDFPAGVTSVSVAGEVATVNLSAGSSTLAADTDVSITSPSDTQVLTFDGASSLWKNKAATGGSGGSSKGAFTNGTSIFTRNDVTASRVLGTAYQNTSGQWMIVSISIGIGSLSATLDVTSDASATPTTKVWSQDGGSGNLVPVIFLVKPGDFYKAALSAGTPNANNALWLEYTMNTATVTDSGDLGPSGAVTRTLTTTFQNTTGSPIIVAARITGMGTASRVTGISDTSATPTDTVFALDSITSIITAFFWVPNGHFYKITAASGSLNTWHEYTIAGVACVKSANLNLHSTNGSPKRHYAPDIAGVNQTYVNNTGLDIWVSSPGTSSSATGTFRLYVDTEPAVPPFIQQHQSTNNAGAGTAKMAQGIIQPGQSYAQTNDNGTTTVISWFEYQLGTASTTSSGVAYVQAGPPDAPPQTPTSMDDEFAANSLNAKWTRLQSGAITDSYSLSRLFLTSVTSGAFLITQPKPTAPCEFTAAFTIDTNNTTLSGNNPAIGLMFGDGTKLVTLMFGFINLTWHFEVENWTNSTTFSSTPVSVPNPWGPTGSGLGYLPKVYLRIKDDGVNFLFSVSNDGISFTQIASVGRAAFLTPTTVGIFAFGATGGTGGFTCDWFRRTDGGYIPSTGTLPGSIAIVNAAIPGSVNLSTTGTLDWFAFNGTSFNPPRAQSGLVVHSKRFGNWIKNSFDWLNGGSGTLTFPAGLATGTLLTSSASDDMAPAMAAVNPNAVLIRSASGTPLNYGFCFAVPAFLAQHVLKFGFFVNSLKVTVTCTMSDGSVAPQTTVVDAVTVGTVVTKEIQVTYNAGTPNAQMIITAEVTANYGGTVQDIAFEYATLA